METKTKLYYSVGEEVDTFLLICDEEVIAEYSYRDDDLKTQDKRQVQFHEIAVRLNCHDELVEALKKLLTEYKLALINHIAILKSYGVGDGLQVKDNTTVKEIEAALKKAEQ